MDAMTTIVAAIEESLDQELHWDEIGDEIGCSGDTVQKVFSVIVGMPAMEYVRRRRLTLAAQHLAAGFGSVTQTAMMYGYGSPDAFARAFRRFHGTTPSAVAKHSHAFRLMPPLQPRVFVNASLPITTRCVSTEPLCITGRSRDYPTLASAQRDIAGFWSETKSLRAGWLSHANTSLSGFLGVIQRVGETGVVRYTIGTSVRQSNAGLDITKLPETQWLVFASDDDSPDAIQRFTQLVYETFIEPATLAFCLDYGLERYPCSGEDIGAAMEIWVPISSPSSAR